MSSFSVWYWILSLCACSVEKSFPTLLRPHGLYSRFFTIEPPHSFCLCCCCCCVTSVVSDSLRPHRRQPTRLPVPWILQARTLEWVAISFSNVWKWKVKVKSLSRIRLLVTPFNSIIFSSFSQGKGKKLLEVTSENLSLRFCVLHPFPQARC